MPFDNTEIAKQLHAALQSLDEIQKALDSATASIQQALLWAEQTGNVPRKLAVPYVAQNNPLLTNDDFTNSDCGPACVAMILKWRGKSVTVDQVSKATGLSAGFKFTTAANLIKAAAAFGVTLIHKFGGASDPIGPLTLDFIKREIDAGLPVIALVHYPSLPLRSDPHFTGGHFVVVVGYDENNGDILYHDPYWMDETGAYIRCSGTAFATAQANCRINGNRPFQGLKVSEA